MGRIWAGVLTRDLLRSDDRNPHSRRAPPDATGYTGRKPDSPSAVPGSFATRNPDPDGGICRLYGECRPMWLYSNPAVSIPKNWADACNRAIDG